MPNKKQKTILRECMILSSCIYNMTNYEVRQQIFKKERVTDFFSLQQKLQTKEDYQKLGRSYALPRIQIYVETNTARFKLIGSKSQNNVGLPKYLKNRKTNTTLSSYLVMDGCQYNLKGDYAHIPLSKQMRKQYCVGQSFKIKFNGICKWKGEQKRGQIHYKDGKFYLHQVVDVAEPNKKISKVKAGIDLGIKRFIALYVNNGEDKVIGSKRFFRHWQYLTNMIAKEQSKLAQHGRQSSRNLSRLFANRNKWQDNLFDNLVAKAFRILLRNNVSELVVGDVKHILEDKGSKQLNIMTHNYWSFGRLLKKIQNKAEQFGITLTLQTEEYTSRTCPICHDDSKYNVHDRIFQCSFCGYIEHRDIIGARNILFKSMCGSTQSTHWCETAPLGVSS